MPARVSDLPIYTAQQAAFALPCPVARAARYLGDPAILLSAPPMVARVVRRASGAYRLTLATVTIPGHAICPLAEIRIAIGADAVTITSVAGEPATLGADEVATAISGTLALSATAGGCAVRATLRLDAAIPARLLPPLAPRSVALKIAESLLNHRLHSEMQAMVRALVAGFPAWDGAS